MYFTYLPTIIQAEETFDFYTTKDLRSHLPTALGILASYRLEGARN